MREFLGENEARESEFQHRTGRFLAGYKLKDALDLYGFDQGLRMLCSEALKVVEVGMRVRIAYVLGQRDTFGHLNRASLDSQATGRPAPRRNGKHPEDRFNYWYGQYIVCQNRAKDDYFLHYRNKYGGRLPIWIAVEAMDFGTLVGLYELMNRNDQNEISHGLGVRNATAFIKWLKTLNAIRNHCAHHARLWNRNLTFEVGRFEPVIAPQELAHAAYLPNRKKIYIPLAILAHLTVKIDDRSTWSQALKVKMQSFPEVANLSPENDMGFPNRWTDQLLWSAS